RDAQGRPCRVRVVLRAGDGRRPRQQWSRPGLDRRADRRAGEPAGRGRSLAHRAAGATGRAGDQPQDRHPAQDRRPGRSPQGRQQGVLNTMTIRSIRTKFLLLVAGVALLVGAVSAGFELLMSGALLREQMVKRGRYIAQNLAYNSKYGVLTEDKPLLSQLLERALSARTHPSPS